MTAKMIINAVEPEEYRVAFVKDGILDGFHMKTSTIGQKVGNIYKEIPANAKEVHVAFPSSNFPSLGWQITLTLYHYMDLSMGRFGVFSDCEYFLVAPHTFRVSCLVFLPNLVNLHNRP